MRLIKAEFRKLTSTHVWWVLILSVVALTALALAVNVLQYHYMLEAPVMDFEGMDPAAAERMKADWEANVDIVQIASGLYTSGQYLGLLFSMVLGILLVTNEYFHQTATTTFLITPRRSPVVFAKLVTAMVWGVGLWLVTTLLALPAGMIFLNTEGYGMQLGEWGVVRSILFNLLAYVVWAIFGVGLGALMRSQIAAIVVAMVLYLIGTPVAAAFTYLIVRWTGAEWLENLQVIFPSVASNLMTQGIQLPSSPPQWVGACVLIGYAVLAGSIGLAITKRRDIA
ncbi:MAG: ABC transporter permease subunit [Longispora sp.]|nr:ABC transporter permease subunit [Longispora sp. (in: high G+C Gram-positive bacteria)]